VDSLTGLNAYCNRVVGVSIVTWEIVHVFGIFRHYQHHHSVTPGNAKEDNLRLTALCTDLAISLSIPYDVGARFSKISIPSRCMSPCEAPHHYQAIRLFESRPVLSQKADYRGHESSGTLYEAISVVFCYWIDPMRRNLRNCCLMRTRNPLWNRDATIISGQMFVSSVSAGHLNREI